MARVGTPAGLASSAAMTQLVTLGLAAVGALCIWIGMRWWHRRHAETAADDAFFGTGRWSHRSNWLRIRGNAVAFVTIGLVLVVVAGARLIAFA
jgi:hypothetical protein